MKMRTTGNNPISPTRTNGPRQSGSMGWSDLFERRLVERLIDDGQVSFDQVERARETAFERGTGLADAMVHLQMVEATDIARATTLCLGLEWLEGIDIESVDFELSDSLPVSYARGKRVLPLWRRNDAVAVALSDPYDLSKSGRRTRGLKAACDPGDPSRANRCRCH